MANQSAVITLKDGTKIVLDNLTKLEDYSNREDLDSISFFGDEETAEQDAGLTIDAGIESQDAGVVTQAAILVQPAPAIKEVPPAATLADALPVITGAVAGAVSSIGMPALTNFAKSFLKDKIKLKKGDSKPEEEKEEPTDCKTHQVKASAKFASLSSRITALEGKSDTSSGGSNLSSLTDDLEELVERIEKLEKLSKSKKGKK